MKDKIYLPGLNGLRAIAALSVILCHIFQQLNDYGLNSSGLFNSFGIYGVTVFFTLSGFLITYLLLKEKEKTTTIAIKKFYIRRVLRIWPLYFLFILIVLSVMKFNVASNLWFYLLMLPNIPWAVGSAGGMIHTIPLLSHYWSLGVEEQFYAFWPFIIKYVKKLKLFLICFCLFFIALKFTLKLFHAPATLVSFVYYTRFSCMIIGGIGAYFFYTNNNFLKIVTTKWFDFLSWFVLVSLVLLPFFGIKMYAVLENEIVSVLTLLLILNQISNPKRIISLENRFFDYLGKISFGLYVYNPLVIYTMAFVFQFFKIENQKIKLFLIVITVISIVIFLAHVSYFYFEKHFLKLKNKFTTVQSVASKFESENHS
ncbi:acyltransferase family protein [Flavobacterium restrictum]|uniref:acyltransferase family protein n=1 Tax=Flavobacterium restrictum TaxID=2594428 RepID=UPI00163DDCC7|nr:acyltransferase [Flavobacterium restrictum]